MHLYVYYEVPLADVSDVEGRVRTMQAELEARCRRIGLQKRTPAAAHAQTWMEVYEDVTDGFEGMLAEAVERHGLVALTGDRHVERFVDLLDG